MDKDITNFATGLELYYKGEWPKAYKTFQKCNLPMAEVFKERTKNRKCPKDWNGIWEMKTK